MTDNNTPCFSVRPNPYSFERHLLAIWERSAGTLSRHVADLAAEEAGERRAVTLYLGCRRLVLSPDGVRAMYLHALTVLEGLRVKQDYWGLSRLHDEGMAEARRLERQYAVEADDQRDDVDLSREALILASVPATSNEFARKYRGCILLLTDVLRRARETGERVRYETAGEVYWLNAEEAEVFLGAAEARLARIEEYEASAGG